MQTVLSEVIKISEATGAGGGSPNPRPRLPNEPGDAGPPAATAQGQLAERAVLYGLHPASGP
jgi:hypothetical protein